MLQDQPTPPEINRFQAAIISRLKIMARLNIAEKRVPQDGRIKLRVSGREIDIRVSIIPMLHGEGIVMRILDKDRMKFSLRGIGMDEDISPAVPAADPAAARDHPGHRPHRLRQDDDAVQCAERDRRTRRPRSSRPKTRSSTSWKGINQIQVQPKVGLTFAASLRSILRHDPDVVLVGEIRDLETAENAVQASLTGHLVFSTLHTNDAAGAFMRLVDMGVEPFLVGSTVEGVMAQRLVRTLCRECREPYFPGPEDVPDDFPSSGLPASAVAASTGRSAAASAAGRAIGGERASTNCW